MKVKFMNASIVFAKADIENITGDYTLTLGYNAISAAASNTTASVTREDDTYPNLTSYFNAGYNRIKVIPKTNVKYIKVACSSSGQSIEQIDSTWTFDDTIINVETLLLEKPAFEILRITLRYVVNGVEQDVTSMSDNLADWVTITLYKESSNS